MTEEIEWLGERKRSLLRNIYLRFIWWVVNPLNNCLYYFKYRLFRKHQYHVVRPRTLKPGYHDQDRRLLHAVMEVLCDYIEECEAVGQNWDDVDPETYPEDPNAPNELNEDTKVQISDYHKLKKIEQWWKNEYPNRHKQTVRGKPFPPKPGELRMGLKTHNKNSAARQCVWKCEGATMDEWRAWRSEIHKYEQEWERKIQRNLMTVIKLRGRMWV